MASYIDALDAELRKALEEQVEHLEGHANASESNYHKPEEWKLRYDGASTLFEIIKSNIGLGNKDGLYLVIKEMNLKELKEYRRIFDNRITEFESEPKVTIYGARHETSVMNWRLTKPEANTDLKKIINEELEGDDYPQCFGIDIRRVFQSEIKEYVR
jgi:hypothetical protein